MGLVVGVVVASAASALAFATGDQHLLGSGDFVESSFHDRLRCDLPHSIDPSDDGLASSQELFSGTEALDILVDRHQELVRIPSICYDDLGDFGEDERWKPFSEIPKVMKKLYPNV